MSRDTRQHTGSRLSSRPASSLPRVQVRVSRARNQPAMSPGSSTGLITTASISARTARRSPRSTAWPRGALAISLVSNRSWRMHPDLSPTFGHTSRSSPKRPSPCCSALTPRLHGEQRRARSRRDVQHELDRTPLLQPPCRATDPGRTRSMARVGPGSTLYFLLTTLCGRRPQAAPGIMPRAPSRIVRAWSSPRPPCRPRSALGGTHSSSRRAEQQTSPARSPCGSDR